MFKKLLTLAAAALMGLGSANAQGFTDGGKYYLQNVECGRFWGAGDHAGWGTRAMLVANPEYVILHDNGNGTYNMETQVSNGGTNYFFGGDYMDGGAVAGGLTFTPVGENYTIANGENYYGYDGSSYVLGKNLAADSEKALWKVVSEDEMRNSLSTATVENPLDATFLFLDPGFGRNNRNYTAWTCITSNLNIGRQGTDKNNNYGCGESWHATFNISQTQEVPNGVYKITGRAFYRQDGSDNEHLPYFKVNDKTENFPLRTGAESSMQQAQASFSNGAYAIEPIYVEVADGSLSISLICEQTTLWCIWDGIELAYYGPGTIAEVLLADYVKAYKAALAEAQGYINQGMFEADANALNTVISENTLNLSDVTKEQLEEATANLVAANLVAAPAAAKYAVYTTASVRVEGNTNVSLTDLVVNAGFETGTMEGWTSIDGGAQANNKNFGKMSGEHFVERWRDPNGNAGLSNGSLTHDVLCLPKGIYTITAEAQNIEQYNGNAGGTGYFLCANEEKAEIGAAGTYSTTVMLNDKDELTIKFLLDNCTGNWISCDNVTLTYVGEDFPAYTLVTGKMNKAVSDAQTAADEAFKANKTIANYNALTAAIEAAQVSVVAYAHLTDAVTKIMAAAPAAQANGATMSPDTETALKALYQAYQLGTIADADAMAKVVEGYELVIPIIKSQTAAAADFTLAIRNQSFEYGDMTGWTVGAQSSDTGVRETSNSIYAATGSDAYYLFNTWWQGVPLTQTIEGLPNGQYTLTASVASDGATIYLLANGEHNEGTETAGEYPSKDKFQEASITFLVKEGVATIGAVGGADGEAGVHKDYEEAGYWWYKADNFRLVKNRNLNPDEMAVDPTGVTLYNGEVEVTTAIELTATDNTVTLTPKFTPENATTTATWTSSDEAVATVSAEGVVTGVAPGTATITVTSTIDATVTASATVNVSYPESTVPATVEIAEGPKKTIYTLSSSNLIKNGSFEYANPYYGWTYGTGSTTPITAEKFAIVTEGAADGSQYLQATVNEGGAAAGSLNTSWEIEAGKTYIFGYQVKANVAATSPNQYIGTSLNNTKGQENNDTKFSGPTYGTEWTAVNYVVDNSAEYKYLVFNARWLSEAKSFDNFFLAEVVSVEETGNLEYLADALPVANIGPDAFQYSVDALNAAKDLINSGSATVAEVEAAYAALKTLNAPKANTRYNIKPATEGHAKLGNAVVAKLGTVTANNPTGYAFNASDAPADYLAQAFIFTSANDATQPNAYYISIVLPEGEVYLTNGTQNGSAAGWKDSQIQGTTDAEKKLAFIIKATDKDNVFNIVNPATNSTIDCQDGGSLYTENQGKADFSVAEASEANVAIAIDEAVKYATCIFPFVPELPAAVKAYTCAVVDGTTLTLEEVTTPEANKPYILEATAGCTANLANYGTANTTSYEAGLLTGVYTETVAPEGVYVLQNLDNGVAFYQVEGEGAVTVPAGKAYLQLAEESEAKAIFFPGDEATAISGIASLTSAGVKGIYNAAGAKVNSLQKGVNIVKTADGKTLKVYVK